jgi:hypothetical protein
VFVWIGLVVIYGRCTQAMCVTDDGGVRKLCVEDSLRMNVTSKVSVMKVYLNCHVCLNVSGLVLLFLCYMPGVMAYDVCRSIACNINW